MGHSLPCKHLSPLPIPFPPPLSLRDRIQLSVPFLKRQDPAEVQVGLQLLLSLPPVLGLQYVLPHPAQILNKSLLTLSPPSSVSARLLRHLSPVADHTAQLFLAIPGCGCPFCPSPLSHYAIPLPCRGCPCSGPLQSQGNMMANALCHGGSHLAMSAKLQAGEFPEKKGSLGSIDPSRFVSWR